MSEAVSSAAVTVPVTDVPTVLKLAALKSFSLRLKVRLPHCRIHSHPTQQVGRGTGAADGSTNATYIDQVSDLASVTPVTLNTHDGGIIYIEVNDRLYKLAVGIQAIDGQAQGAAITKIFRRQRKFGCALAGQRKNIEVANIRRDCRNNAACQETC